MPQFDTAGAGQQPKPVRQQNKKEDRTDNRKKFDCLFTISRHLVKIRQKQLYNIFASVLQFTRFVFYISFYEKPQNQKNQNSDPDIYYCISNGNRSDMK